MQTNDPKPDAPEDVRGVLERRHRRIKGFVLVQLQQTKAITSAGLTIDQLTARLAGGGDLAHSPTWTEVHAAVVDLLDGGLIERTPGMGRGIRANFRVSP